MYFVQLAAHEQTQEGGLAEAPYQGQESRRKGAHGRRRAPRVTVDPLMVRQAHYERMPDGAQRA
ncbi:MAG TPA: hypothetical protein VFB50_01230, partial [Chloroflexota bacterium]|nr:hypothetical protein [Chloroflexota bacterium]